jgi:cyclophilin family peptidyl-prolyl cis-trans isomerase
MRIADELAKLDALRQSGVLTQEEFNAEKAKLLAGKAPSTESSSPQLTGAEAPQREGSWQASDGNSYPPETQPGGPLPPPGSYYVVTPQRSTNGFAVASFVLSILWISGLGSILAVIFALKARGSIRRSNGAEGGDGLAIAGLVIGIVGILGAVPFLLLGVALSSVFNSPASNIAVPSTSIIPVPASTAPPTTVVSSGTFPTPTTQPFTTAAVVPTCPPATGSATRVVLFTKAPPTCISATSVWDATFKTSLGDIVVQMPAASSFAAVNNFVFLAGYQFYNGTFFHRVIPGFVVQGGDPTGTGAGGATGKPGPLEYGYPGYQFTGNTPPTTCTTDPSQAACYTAGDLALANSGEPSSDASQFFFVLPGGQTTLNGEPNYTILGKVVSGMSVVEKIGADGSSSGTPTVRVYLLSVTVKQISG